MTTRTTTVLNTMTVRTLFDERTHVVALPGYLHCDMSNFKLIKRLASGGEGEVHIAELSDPKALDGVDLESIKLRRSAEGKYLVAVKTLRTDTGEYSAEELSKKFHQELSIISSLQKCQNIVKMLGFSEQPRAMVLKLYDSSLEGTIYRKEPPVLPIFSYATDILSALAEMHGSGIVHNDLKPANILIDAATDTLILSDFGVAQVMASHEKVKHRVGMTVDAASFAYASPEVMRFFIEPPRNPTQADMDEWTRNPARDVFAFAIICWEMLSREAPWGAMDSSQIYQQVGKNNFRPTLPTDQTRRKLMSARQATSWTRYETAIGKGAIENLCKILNSAWKSEHQQRASASELLAQIKSIKFK